MIYHCPQCGLYSNLSPDKWGHGYSCPACGTLIRRPPPIATQGVASGPPPVLDDEEEESPLMRRRRPEVEMDMTPMVDVVFLLLIFFMITTAFGLQKSIEMPPPENDQASQQAKPEDLEKSEDDIVVHVTEEDRIFVEGEETATQQELLSCLRNQLYSDSGRRARHLLVFASTEATHEYVVRVLDAAAAVGMDSVRLMNNE